MLRLSKLTDYGLVVMTELAREPERLHSAAGVAEATGVALPTVTKLLKLLSRAGLVRSVRGARGGYRLQREARHVSVAQVVDALEGPVALTECSSEEGLCEQEASCAIRGRFQHINDAIRAALEGVTLAEMVTPRDAQLVHLELPAHRARGEAEAGGGIS
jgi:FeS assembly SUF system regulator